ncbi:hypothetical protein ACFWVU_30335 [Streptomyces sp. NPDC058686]|uniref:hypothetical protein n=1 Tax=Streptomyces sp. NPDC058686 TaxID=3346599 RepID=UPI00365384C3
MAMSRKHYRAFAQILRRARENYPDHENAIAFVARELAGVCAEDNHHFRRQTFHDAATPETSCSSTSPARKSPRTATSWPTRQSPTSA